MSSSSNTLNDVGNLISGPLGQYGMNEAKKYMQLDQYSGFTAKMFTPDIRKFFDVNTNFVGKKLLKLLLPYKQFEWDDEIKKVELYIPIISFVTLILFSTIVEGIAQEQFDPKMGKKVIFIMLVSVFQILIAKFSENTISHLNIGFLELTSFVSYRYVPLAILTIILTVTNMSIPYLNLIGVLYLLFSDTYFCVILTLFQKLELEGYQRQVFREESMGSKIALIVHLVATILICWISNLI